MNTLRKSMGLLWLALIGFAWAAMLTGCGGGGAAKKPKIDVSAQMTALKTAESGKKPDILVALAEAGADAAPAVPILTELLKDEDALNRRLAAYALGQIGPQAAPALPALRALVGDSDRAVMTSAFNAIKSIDPKGPEAKEQLRNVMSQ